MHLHLHLHLYLYLYLYLLFAVWINTQRVACSMAKWL